MRDLSSSMIPLMRARAHLVNSGSLAIALMIEKIDLMVFLASSSVSRLSRNSRCSLGLFYRNATILFASSPCMFCFAALVESKMG